MRILSIIFLWALFGMANAQVLPIRSYGIREGLNANPISAVMRDSRGMLWVGTYNGVNLYDGSRFQQPEMATRSGQIYVTQFAEDRRGQIWVGSWYSGLYKYAGGVFSNYLPDSSNVSSQANSVLHVTELPDGRMLCGTDHNAYVFDGKRFALLDAGNRDLERQITATACTRQGDVFIGVSDRVVLYLKTDHGWRHAGDLMRGYDINKLVVTEDTLWIATDKGLYYVTGQKEEKVCVVSGFVGNAFVDEGGTIWYTGIGGGIWRKQRGHAPEHFTKDNGLPSSAVTCGFTDVEGIVWLGTEYGLAKLTPAGYRFFPVPEGEEGATIIALAKDGQQRLWAGSYNTLFQLEGAVTKDHRRPDGKSYGFVYAMLTDSKRRIWVCSAGGLYCIDKGVARLRSPMLVTSISEDSTGVLWLGGQHGEVVCLANEQFHELAQARVIDERIAGICRDGAGYLWVGYALSGLRKEDWMRTASHGFGPFDSLWVVREWSKDNGYPQLLVRSLRDDHRGNLLVGTRTGGLFVVGRDGGDAGAGDATRGGAGRDGAVRNITREQGLSGNWVKDIVVGGQQVFLATNNGIDMLESGAYGIPARHITFNDDRVPTEFNTVLLQSDTLWLGSARGVLEYSLHGERPDSLAPPVRLLKIAVNGQADSGFRLFTSDTQLRRLSYTQNNVSVDFAALSFRDEDRVRYRYRLEGLDTGWNAYTDRRYVNYMNLAPGRYRFLVEARNGDGFVSREPAAIGFSIAAPFWATSWFTALCIVVLLGMAYGFYRYRLHQALAIERLRARISTDLHDDTGSTLSSISILSDMAMQEEAARAGGGAPEDGAGERGTPLTPMLKEIRDNSLSLLEKMDDIVWSINPRNDTLESLMLRVKRFAAQLFEARGIEYEIDIEPEIRQLRLPMDHRQHVYLILKEAINNLAKYADASQAWLEVRFDERHLELSVRDNGRGFDLSAAGGGNGLAGMQRRAELMGAKVKIASTPGEGTTVSLSLKTHRP